MESIVLNIQEIQAVLPHRYPFLLVDRICEFEPGTRIVGVKNVTANEPFFQGHFPGYPVMPGVLMLEVMAQVGAVLALKTGDNQEQKIVYLAGVDKAKFRKPVTPGDQLMIHVNVLRHKATFWKMAGKIHVDAAVVCEAEMTAMITDAQAG